MQMPPDNQFTGEEIKWLVLLMLSAGFWACAFLGHMLLDAIQAKREGKPEAWEDVLLCGRMSAASNLLHFLLVLLSFTAALLVMSEVPPSLQRIVNDSLPERSFGFVLLFCYAGLLSVFFKFRSDMWERFVDLVLPGKTGAKKQRADGAKA